METIIPVKALDIYKIWIKFADKYENKININSISIQVNP